MALITLAGACFSFGTREIIRDANLAIGGQDRIGLIGANGCGKTTLLDLVAGSRQPDSGTVVRRQRLAIGCLAQETGEQPAVTAFELAYAARPRIVRLTQRIAALEALMAQGQADEAMLDEYADLHRQAQGLGADAYQAQVRSVLRALGLGHDQLDRPVATMSGGEYTRVRLAAVLLGEFDLLLLDEPTNHLDIAATEWLEDYLLGCGKPFVVVSHDRHFLDRVTNHTIELEQARVASYAGSYTAWQAEKKRRLDRQQEDWERQQVLLARMKEFADKWRAGTRARQAASRQKAMERITRVERPWVRHRTPTVGFGAVARSPRLVFALDGVAKRFGSRTIFSGLNLEVERGERIGLVGPNGSGKTTFMRLLTGEEEPDQGSVEVARETAIAYFDQHLADLDEQSTVLEELLSVVELPVPKARDLLGQFLFSGEEVFKPVAILSGGERNRLMLAKIVATRPSVLLLDEPTNHLDIYGREALEAALAGFSGTLVFATHDRRLLDRLAQRTLAFGEEQVEVRYGGYYRRDEPETPAAPEPALPEEDLEDYDWVRREPPARPRPAKKRKVVLPAALDPLTVLEAEIGTREQALAELELRLADAATYRDRALLQETTIAHARLRRELSALYLRWTELAGGPPASTPGG